MLSRESGRSSGGPRWSRVGAWLISPSGSGGRVPQLEGWWVTCTQEGGTGVLLCEPLQPLLTQRASCRCRTAHPEAHGPLRTLQGAGDLLDFAHEHIRAGDWLSKSSGAAFSCVWSDVGLHLAPPPCRATRVLQLWGGPLLVLSPVCAGVCLLGCAVPADGRVQEAPSSSSSSCPEGLFPVGCRVAGRHQGPWRAPWSSLGHLWFSQACLRPDPVASTGLHGAL